MSVKRFSSPLRKTTHARMIRHWKPPVIAAVSVLSACAPAPSGHNTHVTRGGVPTRPDTLSDPLEPLNRGIWSVNKGVLTGVIRPTARVYRTIVPEPARESVNHFARNITYPGRLINHSLQGRWEGAGDESLRFLTNTTVGVAGLFDVASKWDIPKSDANFGQTFYQWGWKPGTYLMLPLLGPSDETHLAGNVADRMADPLTYIYPEEYTVASAVMSFNRLSDSAEGASRFAKSEADSYSSLKYLWSYTAKEDAPDWTVRGPKDKSTLQTFGVATVQCEDPEFPATARERSVRIPSTGKKLKFNIWMQKEHAPVVYINPGLGSHRLANTNLSMAECLYHNGYSVVVISSVFHPEFMENASTAALPAYPPVDTNDLLVSLTEIDRLLDKKYPGRLGKRALVGCSMGAYQSLYLAANEKKSDPSLLRFDRHVGIAIPVSLPDGILSLDRFHSAPKAWPSEQRQARVNNTIHKVADLAKMPRSAVDVSGLPFDRVESQFLIGMNFRLILRDAIFSSQYRNNLGIVQTPLSKWKREAAYEEILGFSYEDYFTRFVLPYYKTKGITQEHFRREADLRTFASGLRGNSKVRVITNRNDFLLAPRDISWLESTLGRSRVKIFPDGGHMGNLGTKPVQAELLRSLDGLK